jgi:23S rRNA (uridine2552-2'-O)-methyltransferase
MMTFVVDSSLMPKPYVPNDKWSKRAAAEGYRARSVYKLMELDERYKLLEPGMRVLDIGAAPGSWLQYVSEKIGERGRVLGVDLKPIVPIAPNVVTRVCDVFDAAALEAELRSLGWGQVDLVLSDIAPNTSGIKDVDQWRSVELSQRVAAIALRYLARGGRVVMKVFRGKDFDAFTRELKAQFATFKVMSAAASRDRSREVYVVCGR